MAHLSLRVLLLSAAFSMGLVTCVQAGTVYEYDYTGNTLNINLVGGCPGFCAVHAVLDFSSQLPDNFSGTASPVSFSITDGVFTLTDQALNSTFQIYATDANGLPTSWYSDVTAPGQAIWTKNVVPNQGFQFPTEDLAGQPAFYESYNLNNPGTWTYAGAVTTVSPAPEPYSLYLFGVGLLVMRATGYVRKRALK